MQTLINYSRKYGSNPELVLAGGGNTSMKENGVLYVKGSGCALSSIEKDNFVAMDLSKLRAIVNNAYPDNDSAREAAFLADMSAAKLPGEEAKRPSVEALLHALFPQRYVLHLHPALVNGLTCGVDGEKVAAELFPEAVWVEACKPGFTLAKLLADKLDGRNTVLLQNHGVFFAADSEEELAALLNGMLAKLNTRVTASMPEVLPDVDISKPFTPDHIVYCGLGPVLPDTDNARLLYKDAQKINWYSSFFGGPLPLKSELVDFITHWEAESYRRKKSN